MRRPPSDIWRAAYGSAVILTQGTVVKVSGIAQSDGTSSACVVTDFTGTMPAM